PPDDRFEPTAGAENWRRTSSLARRSAKKSLDQHSISWFARYSRLCNLSSPPLLKNRPQTAASVLLSGENAKLRIIAACDSVSPFALFHSRSQSITFPGVKQCPIASVFPFGDTFNA